ncbi:hypothetical protein Pst134EB_021928 [Puccinia striiformis f. sp. tritici]|nr:hypothetical protein Pst134EB_021928 [Puccinia striiformis f. sp. tritici]
MDPALVNTNQMDPALILRLDPALVLTSLINDAEPVTEETIDQVAEEMNDQVLEAQPVAEQTLDQIKKAGSCISATSRATIDHIVQTSKQPLKMMKPRVQIPNRKKILLKKEKRLAKYLDQP